MVDIFCLAALSVSTAGLLLSMYNFATTLLS